MVKFFNPQGVKELIWRAGRTTERVAHKRLIKKFPKRTGTISGGSRALKLAQLKGVKKVESLGKRHGVEGLFSVRDKPRTFFKAKKGGLPKGTTLEEMGWAPRDAELASEAMLAFKKSQTPKALLKKHRATLSKIYRSPKSWKERSHLKSVYRARAKAELGAAKLDRSIYRTQTIQKQTGTTKRGKPIWKTIWKEPKREFKKWTKE